MAGCLECGEYITNPNEWVCDKCTVKIMRVTGICTICWENSTKGSKYGDVCDKCLPLTKSPKENENG